VTRSTHNQETHTMTKTTTTTAILEAARTMPQAKFDAAVAQLLTEATAAAMAAQAMLDARRQTAA
jgi:hypothetical protein